MTGTQKTTKKRPPKIDYKGYLNVNLSKEDDIQFDIWYAANGDCMRALLDVLDFGYKISIQEDEYNAGILVSIYAKSKKLDWAGWTLSAWAGDVPEAVALLVYKHYFMCDQNWEAFIDKPTRSHAKRG